MTFLARRRLLWTITALEIAAFAWLVFGMACPTRTSLESAGLVSRDGLFSSVHGEPRCWLFFGLLTAFSLGCALFADRSIAKRARHHPSPAVDARA